MNFSSLQAMQQENLSRGSLLVTVNTLLPNRPIPGASISISYTGDPDSVIEEVTTDSSGQSPVIELPAPPLEYSLSPSENQPYAEYNIEIRAEGYEPVSISGTELLPDVTAIQPVLMTASKEESPDRIVIPAHTLFGDYPPKIPEAEVKPMEETGEIVLSRVVVPEYVVVHDGSPDDSTASNYFVRYRDYIKNVACSEIYATWPAETLRANILAIMSFTLNRVYTEWYRNHHKFSERTGETCEVSSPEGSCGGLSLFLAIRVEEMAKPFKTYEELLLFLQNKKNLTSACYLPSFDEFTVKYSCKVLFSSCKWHILKVPAERG